MIPIYIGQLGWTAEKRTSDLLNSIWIADFGVSFIKEGSNEM